MNVTLKSVPHRVLCLLLAWVIVLAALVTVVPIRVEAVVPLLVVGGIAISAEALAFIGACLVAAGMYFASQVELESVVMNMGNTASGIKMINDMLVKFAEQKVKEFEDKRANVVEMHVSWLKNFFSDVKDCFSSFFSPAVGEMPSSLVGVPVSGGYEECYPYSYDFQGLPNLPSVNELVEYYNGTNTLGGKKLFSFPIDNGQGTLEVDQIKDIYTFYVYVPEGCNLLKNDTTIPDYPPGYYYIDVICSNRITADYIVTLGRMRGESQWYSLGASSSPGLRAAYLTFYPNSTRLAVVYLYYFNAKYYVSSFGFNLMSSPLFQPPDRIYKNLQMDSPFISIPLAPEGNIFTDAPDFPQTISGLGEAAGVLNPTDDDVIPVLVPNAPADVIGKLAADVVANVGTETKTETDPKTETDSDYEKLKQKAKIIDVFPFCIPFDFINAIKSLAVEPKAPVFTIDFTGTIFGEYIWELDMSEYEVLAKVVRWVVWIGVFVGLMFATRKLMKW